MKTIKKLEQAVMDVEIGKGSTYDELLLEWYQRSVMGEEEQLLLPDLQRIGEYKVRRILKTLKNLGVKRFAVMNYGTIDGIRWELIKIIREYGYDLGPKVQVMKKVTEDYPDELYDASLMEAA